MPIVRDWVALRRPLRSCAIGALVLLVFFAVWQFLIPGDNSNPVADWASILALSLCLSSGVGLTVSATRRLWRSARRAASLLPVSFLVGVMVALSSAAGASGVEELIAAAWLLGLLLSAGFSAYIIVTAVDATPSPSPPAPLNADDPDAYVRDIPGNGKPG